jgi:short-subunit dehydrogenase
MKAAASIRPVAIITGASDGIGAELARVFSRNGHEVMLVARRRDKLEDLANYIESSCGKRPIVVALDLSGPEAIEELSINIAQAGVTVKYLVNNAGFGIFGCVTQLSPDEQLAMLDLNTRALTALTLRFLPEIILLRGGIMNVASTAAFIPVPGGAVYAATKAYVASFSEALSEELRSSGVKVSCLCPGPVATGFQARAGIKMPDKMPGLLSVDEVARQGYKGLMTSKLIVIPGFANKLMSFIAGVMPRRMSLPAIAANNKKITRF